METSRTILVADDVPMFRELCAVFLARSGRVMTAGSAFEALEVARETRPDLILSDLGMPDVDGAELCRRIKDDPELGGTPVIVIMGSHRRSDHARVIRAGADDVLTKPISRLALLAAVNRFLRSDQVSGLPRIAVETSVRVRVRGLGSETWGVARNLSRGGIFLETSSGIAAAGEVQLSFTIPDTSIEVSPTAEVVWRAPTPKGSPAVAKGSPAVGYGMRFLELERDAMRGLEDFVFERTTGERARPVASLLAS